MRLSPREAQILDLLQQGFTNKEIGAQLAISHNTARDCIVELMRRFDVKGRAALAALHTQKTLQKQMGTQLDRRAGADRRSRSLAADPIAGGGLISPPCSLQM